MAEESKLQAKILRHLERNNVYCFKVVSASRTGVLDIVACVNGLFVAIEVKSSRGKTTQLQDYNIRAIGKSKGIALVIAPNDFSYLTALIESLLRKKKI